MTDEQHRPEANHCFVCGPSNPQGLRIVFRMDGDVCRASFRPGEHHVGYHRIVHGGIVFSVLDDVMANWLYLQGMDAHTAHCEIRYRQPAMLGDELRLEGRLLKRKGRVAVMQGKAYRVADDVLLAETEARFMIVR